MGLFYGFGGSHHRQMDNIALVQHGLIKVIDVRCGDKSLTTAFHSGHQRIASSAVQLAHHIVKKEHRLLLDDLLDCGSYRQLILVHKVGLVPLAYLNCGDFPIVGEFYFSLYESTMERCCP